MRLKDQFQSPSKFQLRLRRSSRRLFQSSTSKKRSFKFLKSSKRLFKSLLRILKFKLLIKSSKRLLRFQRLRSTLKTML